MIIKFLKLPKKCAKKGDLFEKSNMLKAWCMKNIKLWLWKYWRTLKTFWQRICFCKRMLLFFTFQLFILSYAYKRNLAWHSFFCYTNILYSFFYISWKIVMENTSFGLKFIYSEIWEDHKILRNLYLTFDCMYCSHSRVKISQNFVAFSEYMNFTMHNW